MFDTVFSCQWFAALPSISRLFLLRGGIRFRYQTGSLPREVSLLNVVPPCHISNSAALHPSHMLSSQIDDSPQKRVWLCLTVLSKHYVPCLHCIASTHTISSQGKILDPMAPKKLASTNRYLLDWSILLLCVYPSIPSINEDSISFPYLPYRPGRLWRHSIDMLWTPTIIKT